MNPISDAFRRMADTIDHNEGKPFGGAIVVVVPSTQEGGEPEIFDTILLGRGNAIIFWESMKKVVQDATDRLNNMERRSAAGWNG